MAGRGHESKNMGICRKTAYNGGKYCEHVGNAMVGRGSESKNIGKCRKL